MPTDSISTEFKRNADAWLDRLQDQEALVLTPARAGHDRGRGETCGVAIIAR